MCYNKSRSYQGRTMITVKLIAKRPMAKRLLEMTGDVWNVLKVTDRDILVQRPPYKPQWVQVQGDIDFEVVSEKIEA